MTTTQPKPGFPGSPEYDRLYRRFREAQEWYDREWADGNTTRAANALELQNDILSELARLQNG